MSIFDMSVTDVIFSAFYTLFVMFIFPVIFLLIMSFPKLDDKKFERKTILALVISNAIICFFIFSLISFFTDGAVASGLPVVIWSIVIYKIFMIKFSKPETCNLENENIEKDAEKKSDMNNLEKSTLSKKESLQNTNKKEDYSNNKNSDKETLFSVIKDYINRKKRNKTVQKTEDKKKSNILFIIFSVVSVVFLITSCVFFYHLYTNINDLNAEISDLNAEISDLKKDKSELMNTINELNSTVSSQSEEISHWKNKWREVWIEHLLCDR